MIDLPRLRAGIPALTNSIYLNTGTFGPMPTVVADEIRRAYGEIEQQGTFSPAIFWQMELEGFEAVRGQVAALLHAQTAEIALDAQRHRWHQHRAARVGLAGRG